MQWGYETNEYKNKMSADKAKSLFLLKYSVYLMLVFTDYLWATNIITCVFLSIGKTYFNVLETAGRPYAMVALGNFY